MATLIEMELQDEIGKLLKKAKETGWEFTFHVGHYPIVVTFKTVDKKFQQLGMLPEEQKKLAEEEQRKFTFIFNASNTKLKNDDKAEIPMELLNTFKGQCKRIIYLLYMEMHYSLKEVLKEGQLQGLIEQAIQEAETKADSKPKRIRNKKPA